MIVAGSRTMPLPPRSGHARHTCGCSMAPDRFLAMLASFHRQPAKRWTDMRPLTHPLHWTCGADAFQRALRLAPGDGAPRPGPDKATAALRARKPVADAGDGPDLVLVGGKVFTADRSRPWAEGLAVAGGRITAVGGRAEIEPLATDRTLTVELDGRLVIPGLNDAHMHHTPDPAGVRLPIDPVADPDFEAIRPLIARAVRETPPGTWIFGVMGERLINDRALDRRPLDIAAPDHPVILLGLTNHTNVLNTAAMRRLGLADDEPDPLGGFFERLPGSARLSGRINEYAQWTPQRCFASMATIEEGVASLHALSDQCLAYGITTVQNMSWTPAARYLEMLEAADLPIRVRLIRFPPSGPAGRVLSEGAGLPRRPLARVTVSGTKWILDGTTVERAAAMGRPYADRADTSGRMNFDLREIGAMIGEAARSGDQLLLHAIGTEAVEMVLQAVEGSDLPSAERPALRMEHGDGLTPDQLRRAKAQGLGVVQNPSHFLFPEIYGPRFGEGEPYALFRSLFGAGIPTAIGSDGPLDPFLGLFAATTHPARPDEACDLATALEAYTAGSAAAEGLGDCKGRIRPGFVADLAVLSRDLFEAAPADMPGTCSLMTIVDGRIAYCARPLAPV